MISPAFSVENIKWWKKPQCWELLTLKVLIVGDFYMGLAFQKSGCEITQLEKSQVIVWMCWYLGHLSTLYRGPFYTSHHGSMEKLRVLWLEILRKKRNFVFIEVIFIIYVKMTVISRLALPSPLLKSFSSCTQIHPVTILHATLFIRPSFLLYTCL